MDIKRVSTISPAGLLAKLNQGMNLELLDVRTAAEYRGGHIPGSKLLSLDEISDESLAQQLGQSIERGLAPTYLTCKSGIIIFAAPDDAQRLRNEFPVSLHGQNILTPSSGSSLRRNLEIRFQGQQTEPLVVAEFEDRALMKTFGERGTGVFTSPTAVERDVIDKYRVEVVGRSDEITESFFVISPERHIKHPAVNTITQAAKITYSNRVA
ncbi:MAG: rhodanese-like domain-containing protein [Candidatus Thiodiazotropha lotti]|nr:rhodanese-like domain-containing protein [Candidatus Thiodiazotropha lotti]MCW4195796.1 rhodanese-like domain-containing protein [Candidatus Thiodiazotropha lotti]MCW4200041.1 rhodanese-like domain-containing protein [Candidatus Thiodiazotropha lotti]